MAADLRPALVVLERPVLDPQRPEQRLDGELVVRLAGDGLAHQGRVGQRVGRVAAGGPGIERQPLGPRVAAVAQDVFPRPVVGRAGRLRADARGVIEQLLDGDLRLARVAQRLRPGDEVERPVVEAHPARRPPLPALLRGDREHRGTDRLRAGGDPARVRRRAVAPLLLQDDVPPPDDDRGEIAIVRLPEPLAQLRQLVRVHAGQAADGIRVVQPAPAARGFGRREVLLADGSGRDRGEVSSFSFA